MDASATPSVTSQKVFSGIVKALTSAVLEWLLMFMLFIDASFSYLITRFARYCELQIPCLLCSRLDHVLGNENVGFHWDLICGNHKLELSSLVLCRAHGKLVDVHGICESCLFSFATINKSNVEANKLLVGKLGDDTYLERDLDPLLGDHILGSSGIRNCSCCNEQWISRGYSQKLLQTKSIDSEATDIDVPLFVNDNKDDLKKIRNESYVSLSASPMEKNSFDPLPHIEYTMVNVTSDTESDVPLCDYNSVNALIHETEELKEDFTVKCVQMEPHIDSLANNLTSEKLIHMDSIPEPSLLESEVQLEVTDTHSCIASAAAIGHGLEELNWQQAEHNTDISVTSQILSFEEDAPSTSLIGTLVDASVETLEATSTGEIGKKLDSESGEISKAGSETQSELNPVTSDTGSQTPNVMDLGDVYKLAVGNRGRQLSGKLLEQRSLKDSARVSEDLKLLLSQISAARGIDLSLNDLSPRLSGNSEEMKTADVSSSIAMQILQRRISLERNESCLSVDGSSIGEIEGESAVDRLKRQVEHDKILMSTLYKELEEERNASAVAANQAMAMITRLQEEKASLNMEALQYLRMMEEQAEFDDEALQKANDLLAEKDKEIQELEAGFELYQKKFGNVSMLENIVDPETRAEHSDAHFAKNISDKSVLCDRIDDTDKSNWDENINQIKNSFLGFEDDRLYILQCLKKLEEKLHLFSSNGVPLDIANGEYAADGVRVSDLKEHKNVAIEEKDLQKDIVIDEGNPRAQEGWLCSYEDPQHISRESNEFSSNGKQMSVVCRETDLVALRNEFSNLGERLEALEVDRSFLEHSINSLRIGDKGLQFIQEIACHLRELRLNGIKRKDQPFS